ncbi:tetratricopeptide repeat protein [Bryobacter aggregatus]|uniref:tetratricopeptide repeat protein n=1 Tax=Bryobacter aggregatus TaxID=360054 RepID=UPI0004E0EEFF|nr:hypothetical protein [Bryobacter aggregatus]
MYLFAILIFTLSASAQLLPTDQAKPPVATETVAGSAQPQAASLGGNALFAPKDPDGRIAKAYEALAKAPNDPEEYVKAGRVMESVLHFRDAVTLYTNAIEKFPKDYRFYRLRGQRYITTRQFDLAIADLKTATSHGTGSFEPAYYLGLAYYFNGDHEKAAEEFGRCEAQMKKPVPGATHIAGNRTCESMRDDLNWLIPLQYWHYLALRRAGKMEEAKAYLDTVSPLLEIKASKAFYDTLLFFKGIKEINEMLQGANEGSREFLTRAAGTATFLFTEGERAKACSLWRRDSMDQNWDHLGVINAESEYFRNSKAACALYAPAATPAPKQ